PRTWCGGSSVRAAGRRGTVVERGSGMKPLPSVSARSSICALVLLSAGGCSEPASDPDLARAVIGPRGGIITSVDEVLTIAIPPGALEQSVELFIRPTDEPPDVFGQAYLVRPN